MKALVVLVALLMVPVTVGNALAAPEESFRVATDNIPQAQIAGSFWRAGDGEVRGTLIMCHGFGRSMHDFRGYHWIAGEQKWNVVRFDFREHGRSSHSRRLPTLGYHEIWDLKAVIDYAEAKGLAKPYVCYGHSMGAAIALRWAGQDRRVAGVLAQSPFRNALDATHKFRPNDVRVQLASHVLVRGGRKRMLEQVDIPSAVRGRDDLVLWLTTGERDYFLEDDQRAILAASASPDAMKKLVVIPSAGHGEQWKWDGNDALIRSFLAEVSAGPPAARAIRAAAAVWGAAAIAAVLVAAAVICITRRRRLRPDVAR